MNILITGSQGPAGQALARQLTGTGHTLIGADMKPGNSDLFTDTVAVSAASDPNMIDELEHIIAAHSIDLLIPTVSDELPSVADAAPRLRNQAKVMIGSPEAIRAAHDKHVTMTRLSDAGVPIPKFALPSSFQSCREALAHFGGPIIVKPRTARGGRGVRLAERPNDIDWSELDDTQIVQEFAPGQEYAPMVYRPLSDRFETHTVVVEKTELKQGRIGNAVQVRRLQTAEAPDAAQTALAAAEALGLTGPADLDIRRTTDGIPVVLEVNARFGANSESAPELLKAVLREYAPDSASGVD